MLNKIIYYLNKADWLIIAAVSLLLCFSLVEIYGISLSQSGQMINFKHQLLFAGVGMVCLIVFSLFDYYKLFTYSNYLYILSLVLLIAVLIFGSTIKGTRGWFGIFGFGIQPVELVKVFLILFLAKYLSTNYLKANILKHLLITGSGVLLLIGLVLKQPDLGSAFILFCIWLVLLIVAGLEKKYILILVVGLVVVGGLAWSFYLKPYQKQRVIAYLNLQTDVKKDYNVNQAIIAIGAGSLTGRGLGFGSQSQLKFLPEAKTDFIFAVIAEELGFVGVFLVLFLFLVIFYRLLINLPKINNDFGIFFVLGAMGVLAIEMFINIGMNLGVVPVIGIALPFLSYGGSSLIANLIIIGIIESVIIRSKIKNY